LDCNYALSNAEDGGNEVDHGTARSAEGELELGDGGRDGETRMK
jgi:hypothetical protein